MSLRWFGFKLKPLFQVHRRFNNSDCASQGLSVLQIGLRHLLYLGSNDGRLHVCVGFLWLTRSNPH